jgi:6-phosphogluconolactonase
MRSRLLVLAALLAVLLFGAIAANAQEPATEGGFVYVMSNRAEGNSIFVFRRASGGALTLTQEVPTKGLGTGFTNDPLASQGSLSLSNDGKLLLAVNAGSGDITAFAVSPNGITFGSKVKSGGAFPVSVSAFGELVYVLNQLGTANITGFTSDAAGHLQRIPGSTRKLAGGALAQPAQVSFTPDGKQLLVTEKGTDLIDVFAVQAGGLTTGPEAVMSSGHTPFGFAFGPSDSVIVSEAERGLPKAATASSYVLGGGGLQPVSAKVPDGQTAACWVAVTGGTAWVVNTGTSTISSYAVSTGGALTLQNPVAAFTGANTAPIDLATSSDGSFIYVLKSAAGAIAGYKVNGESLAPIFNKAGLPLSIQGIAAR